MFFRLAKLYILLVLGMSCQGDRGADSVENVLYLSDSESRCVVESDWPWKQFFIENSKGEVVKEWTIEKEFTGLGDCILLDGKIYLAGDATSHTVQSRVAVGLFDPSSGDVNVLHEFVDTSVYGWTDHVNLYQKDGQLKWATSYHRGQGMRLYECAYKRQGSYPVSIREHSIDEDGDVESNDLYSKVIDCEETDYNNYILEVYKTLWPDD